LGTPESDTGNFPERTVTGYDESEG